jgi:hypothetical protein
MEEYKNATLQILNSAKEQLSEEEYRQLLEFVRNIVKEGC